MPKLYLPHGHLSFVIGTHVFTVAEGAIDVPEHLVATALAHGASAEPQPKPEAKTKPFDAGALLARLASAETRLDALETALGARK